MLTKFLIASTTLLFLSASCIDANSQTYGYSKYRRAHAGKVYGAKMGLRKKTKTGGPAGGSMSGSGG